MRVETVHASRWPSGFNTNPITGTTANGALESETWTNKGTIPPGS